MTKHKNKNSTRRIKKTYKDRIKKTIGKALAEHPRTIAIRCDLRFPLEVFDQFDESAPSYQIVPSYKVISRFFESFKARVESNLKKRISSGVRVHKTSVRYVWVREKVTSDNWHYHICIMLNKDSYYSVGNHSTSEATISSFIKNAWASALGIDLRVAILLARIPDNPMFLLNKNDKTHLFDEVYESLIDRLDYLAKEETKYTEDGGRSFGCSSK